MGDEYSQFQVFIGTEGEVLAQLGEFLAYGAGELVLAQGVDVGDEGEGLGALEAEGVHALELHRLHCDLDALVAYEDFLHCVLK